MKILLNLKFGFLLKEFDLDRLVGKLAAEKFHERTRLLRQSLINIQKIRELLSSHHDVLALARTSEQFGRTHFLSSNHLNEELPVNLNKMLSNLEVSEELDRLRNLQSKGKGFWMKCAKEKSKEQEFLLLKIDFNNVLDIT